MVNWTSRLRKKKKSSAVHRSVSDDASGKVPSPPKTGVEWRLRSFLKNLIPADRLPSAAAALAELFPPKETLAEPPLASIKPFDTDEHELFRATDFRSSATVRASSFEASVLAAFEAPAETVMPNLERIPGWQYAKLLCLFARLCHRLGRNLSWIPFPRFVQSSPAVKQSRLRRLLNKAMCILDRERYETFKPTAALCSKDIANL